jgi:hypothetical protein
VNYHDYETLPAVDKDHPVVNAMIGVIPDDAPIWRGAAVPRPQSVPLAVPHPRNYIPKDESGSGE